MFAAVAAAVPVAVAAVVVSDFSLHSFHLHLAAENAFDTTATNSQNVCLNAQ